VCESSEEVGGVEAEEPAGDVNHGVMVPTTVAAPQPVGKSKHIPQHYERVSDKSLEEWLRPVGGNLISGMSRQVGRGECKLHSMTEGFPVLLLCLLDVFKVLQFFF
jgi:hypothetical protein